MGIVFFNSKSTISTQERIRKYNKISLIDKQSGAVRITRILIAKPQFLRCHSTAVVFRHLKKISSNRQNHRLWAALQSKSNQLTGDTFSTQTDNRKN